MVERLQDEFLTLVIQRVYNIIERSGGFPPIPEELQDVIGEADIEVDYISPLAQAQKMSGLVNIEQAIAQTAQMAQIWPEVTKKIDPLGAIAKYFEMLGVPAAALRSDEAVEQMLKAEQEEAQRQQQMQEGLAVAQATAPVADAAKNLTAAANDANPAISSWMGIPGGWD